MSSTRLSASSLLTSYKYTTQVIKDMGGVSKELGERQMAGVFDMAPGNAGVES